MLHPIEVINLIGINSFDIILMDLRASFDLVAISKRPQADFWVIEGERGISVQFSSLLGAQLIPAAVRIEKDGFP